MAEEDRRRTNHLFVRLLELEDADDWRGVVALELEVLALVWELRGPNLRAAGEILDMLGGVVRAVSDSAPTHVWRWWRARWPARGGHRTRLRLLQLLLSLPPRHQQDQLERDRWVLVI